MSACKERLKDVSLFRKLYIVDLFFCNIAFLQIPAYAFLFFLFIWGVYLVVYKQKRDNTLHNLRFGLWIGGFLAVSAVSILCNISVTTLHSIIMFLHTLICFLIFYGMHTERNFDFKDELYTIARLIVYISTVANIIGIFCLMCGIKFEWFWIKFTIYENRFTGIFVNPNLLGFVSVVSIVCCHMLYKRDFMKAVNRTRVSKIWIIACVSTNVFSLILCDSNASMVLALGYAIAYVVYTFFADKAEIFKSENKVSRSKVFVKVISLFFVGTFLVSSVLMFRGICQAGFSIVISKTNSLINLITEDNILVDGQNDFEQKEPQKEVTFSHENEKTDSGRFQLWQESVNLFKLSPVIGISNGNIVLYSEKYANGILSYSYHKNDLHNGFLTVLISTGALGFILFCIFGFRFTKHSAQHLFLQKKTYLTDIYPCLFSFLFAYLIYAFFEKALLYDISFMVMWFWLMMGYISCYVVKVEPALKKQYIFNKKYLKRTLL